MTGAFTHWRGGFRAAAVAAAVLLAGCSGPPVDSIPVKGGASQVQFSADGRSIVGVQSEPVDGVYRDSLCLWNVRSGERVWRRPLGQRATIQIAAAENAVVVVEPRQRRIKMIDLETGSQKSSFRLEHATVQEAISSDGRLLAGASSEPQATHLWDCRSGKLLQSIELKQAALDLEWLPGRRVLMVLDGDQQRFRGQWRIYDVSGKKAVALKAPLWAGDSREPLYTKAFDAKGRMADSDGGEVVLADVRKGKPVESVSTALLLGAEDRNTTILRDNKPGVDVTMAPNILEVRVQAVSDDGNRVAVAIRWKEQSNSFLETNQGAFGEEQAIVSYESYDSWTYAIYDFSTKQVLRRLPGYVNDPRPLRFSPQGDVLAVMKDGFSIDLVRLPAP